MTHMKNTLSGILVFCGSLPLMCGCLPQNQPASETVPLATVTPTTLSYTLQDVALHATATDCWMAIEGKVYNVTEFINKHPGGEAIVAGCGKDATTLFNERPSQGHDHGPHPELVKAMMQPLEVGELVEETL